ncbi:TIGR03943 family putative permease subunit [Aminipila luticellarii]|uniref:Energy transducer TonB n=1 Tax=Aminipila luticellarii TaxID=2507160 RepID=A0A410PVI1_9FIRM|nr:energy transducer TonB [Aminipila luticellarii]QAT42933.1 energy transducer TonB [Aminipila luticellarii]
MFKMKNKRKLMLFVSLVLSIGLFTGCTNSQSAASNKKINSPDITSSQAISKKTAENNKAVVKENSTYDCDIEADKKAFDKKIDIMVGDNYYATQINDWYMNFGQYKDKTVEIEGFYIGDYQPYDLIGRFGPSCPYCSGGYVSFEILSDEDMTQYKSGKDWIRVRGILRAGDDSVDGPFYYIEALEIQKMDTAGKTTVTN